jgi:hypothetical protein
MHQNGERNEMGDREGIRGVELIAPAIFIAKSLSVPHFVAIDFVLQERPFPAIR